MFVCVFTCLVITGKKLIVKVKVQSNQDVNDPSVMAAILNKVGSHPLLL